jgi:hypothetical protein
MRGHEREREEKGAYIHGDEDQGKTSESRTGDAKFFVKLLIWDSDVINYQFTTRTALVPPAQQVSSRPQPPRWPFACTSELSPRSLRSRIFGTSDRTYHIFSLKRYETQ